MRNDLAKMLCEKPRRGSYRSYHEFRRHENNDPELHPARRGMRWPYNWNYNRKEFSDHLAPLKGYLKKSVGRPWNDVYSELCAALVGGYTVIEHVKTHLRQYVEVDPDFIDGKPYYKPHSAYQRNRDEPVPIVGGRYQLGLYVDQGGILRAAPHRQIQKRKEETKESIRIDASSWYQRIDGVWYRVDTRELPKAGPDVGPVFDVLFKVWLRCRGHELKYTKPPEMRWDWAVPDDLEKRYGTAWPSKARPRYAYSKRQLSSKEIRKAGLNKL